ncbi:MAG: M4 family metallopeptidase [Verrucomicrobia bacterium]|nr:M4 family metallopeptidase [Verrucomicrobiota bacterium]
MPLPTLARRLATTFVAGLVGPALVTAYGQDFQEQIAQLVSRVEPVDTNSVPPDRPPPPARYFTTPEGYLRFMSAAQGYHLPSSAPSNTPPESVARMFITNHASLFGVSSPQVAFQPFKLRPGTNRTTVRLQQTYAHIPVFAAQVNVQVSARGGIVNASSDIARNVEVFDTGIVSIVPTLAPATILGLIHTKAETRHPGAQITNSPPLLSLFFPSVLSAVGPPRLVWLVETACERFLGLNERWLIDAHSGDVVRCYPRYYYALDRRIYDADNTDASPGDLVRAEGDPACGLADADNAYDYLGDTYDFYDTHHGRDSIDDDGMTVEATVRYCDPDYPCPWDNACWVSWLNRIRFGQGCVADDVTAHEYTHGVTDDESNLAYENTSGAINESFSDIWGEFVDLVNGHGDDSPAVRWLIGEDLAGGSLRNMQDPTATGGPDRRGSPSYVPAVDSPDKDNDYGGVHSNCGVCNKLAYLLTDGDTFNGYTISGVGIAAVANLFYEVQVNLLNSGADWTDLYLALCEAAVNRSWSIGRRNNLYQACKAVEIAQERDVYVDGDGSNLIQTGSESHPFHTLGQGVDYAFPGDTLHLDAGSYDETLLMDKTLWLVPQNGSVVLGQ